MDYVHPLDTEHRKLSDRDKLFLDVRLAGDRLAGQLLAACRTYARILLV